MIRHPPSPPLFPSTTLFRSGGAPAKTEIFQFFRYFTPPGRENAFHRRRRQDPRDQGARPAGASSARISMSDDLLRHRSEFPILERTTYLISNSLGAMPRGVYDAMKGYADTWASRGVRAWEERWWMLAAEVGG